MPHHPVRPVRPRGRPFLECKPLQLAPPHGSAGALLDEAMLAAKHVAASPFTFATVHGTRQLVPYQLISGVQSAHSLRLSGRTALSARLAVVSPAKPPPRSACPRLRPGEPGCQTKSSACGLMKFGTGRGGPKRGRARGIEGPLLRGGKLGDARSSDTPATKASVQPHPSPDSHDRGTGCARAKYCTQLRRCTWLDCRG